MKRRVLLVVLMVVAALLVTSIAHAKRGQVKIRVIDVDAKGRESRVAGANIQIWDSSGTILKKTVTDAKGNATITGLEGNTEYTIRVIAPDGKIGLGGFTTNKNGGAGLQVVKVKLP